MERSGSGCFTANNGVGLQSHHSDTTGERITMGCRCTRVVGRPALNQTLDLIVSKRFTGRVSTERGAPQSGKKSQMKVTVDQDTCASSGNCVMHAPGVFDQRDEDGVVVLLVGEPPAEHGEATHKAAASCPAQAIHVEE